jgi:thymidylate kinase
LEISPELGLARRASRGGAEELLERAEVQRKVAALYPLAAALRPNDSVLVVDGTPDADTVGASILERVTTALRL